MTFIPPMLCSGLGLLERLSERRSTRARNVTGQLEVAMGAKETFLAVLADVSCSRSTEARGLSGWSRATLFFAFLLLAVFWPGAALPQEVTRYLAELTGPGFTNCGFYDVVPRGPTHP